MDVSPHLRIWVNVNIDGDIEKALQASINNLMPIYERVKDQNS